MSHLIIICHIIPIICSNSKHLTVNLLKIRYIIHKFFIFLIFKNKTDLYLLYLI